MMEVDGLGWVRSPRVTSQSSCGHDRGQTSGDALALLLRGYGVTYLSAEIN